MSVPVFVDTNVLVYARDSGAGEKNVAARAWMEHLWLERTGRISYQVLQEFYVTVTLKLKPGLSVEAARRDVRALAEWKPATVDGAMVEGAWLTQDRYGLSWWDSLIVSAAQLLECEYLLSEDFQAGQIIGGVRIVSPFERDPGALVNAAP